MSLSIGLSIGIDRAFANASNTPLIATPMISNVSATGASPLVMQVSDGSYVAGKYLQWEFTGSLTPAKNADGSYTTTTQKGVTFIDGDSWARLDLATGYNTPSGAFAFHCRVLQDNPNGAVTVTDQLGNTFNADASGWSTDYTDTIIVSAATFDPANKVSFVTLSNGNLTMTAGANAGQENARATIQPSSNDTYCEFTMTLGGNANQNLLVGIVDGAFAISTAGNNPNTAATGCGYRRDGAIYHDGTVTGGAATYTTGDKIGVRYNKTTKLVTFYKNGVAVSPTVTLTLSNPYAFGAGFDVNDSIVANYGGSAFSFQPSGTTFYG